MRNIVQNESRESSLAMPSQNNVSETNERTYRQHDLCSDGNWSSFGRSRGVALFEKK